MDLVGNVHGVSSIPTTSRNAKPDFSCGADSASPPSQLSCTDKSLKHHDDASHHGGGDGCTHWPTSSRSLDVPPPLSNLPLLTTIARKPSRKDLNEFGGSARGREMSRQQGDGMGSSFADGAPLLSPRGQDGRSPPRLLLSSLTIGRAVTTSGEECAHVVDSGALVKSPTVRDPPKPVLRVLAAAESFSLVDSLVSYPSLSPGGVHGSKERRFPGNCEDVSGVVDSGDHGATSPVQLPLISRPLASGSFSVQVRQLTSDRAGADVLGSANVPSLPSCSTSHTSIHCNDKVVSCAPSLEFLLEASTSAGGPRHSLPLPTRFTKRRSASENEISSCTSTPQFSRSKVTGGMDSKADAKMEEHLSDVLGTSDRDGCVSIFGKVSVQLAVGWTPPALTDDATGPWSSKNSGAMGASTAASPAVNSTVVTSLMNSGPNNFNTAFLEGGEYAPEAARLPTDNSFGGPKHASFESFDGDNCSTAARRATGQQVPSDFDDDDAVLRRRAKRRLKRLQNGGSGSNHRRKWSGAVGGGDQLSGEVPKRTVAVHKSDSAIARKRQRKLEQRQERMKKMSSTERREYREKYQLRRAAKKTIRASAAAPTPSIGPDENPQRICSKQQNNGSPSATGSPAIEDTTTNAEQHLRSVDDALAEPDVASTNFIPHELVPVSEGKPSELNPDDMVLVEDAASRLSPHRFANTCGASITTSADSSIASMLARQAQRSIKASGGGAPVSPTAAATTSWLVASPAAFHRRFIGDADPTKKEREHKNGLSYLVSSVPSNVYAQVGQSRAYSGETEVADVKRDSALEANGYSEGGYGEDVSRALPRNKSVDGKRAYVGVRLELLPRSNSCAQSPTPHTPKAAAGSAAAAILEIQQRQGSTQESQPALPTASAWMPAVLSTAVDVNHGVKSADVGGVSLRTPISCGCGAQALPDLSSMSQPEFELNLSTELGVVESVARCVVESAPSASHSLSARRLRATDGESTAVETAVTGPVFSGGHDEVETSPTPGVVPQSSVAAAAASTAARKAKYSSYSSCSSFRSRSSDDESADGSSDYSYSSSGSLVPEVLPLVEGCSVPPPDAAFSDLNYRYSCVPLLHSHAEPGIIHEWNLAEGCWGSVETSVVLNPKPFAQGNMRASYHMIDMCRFNCLLVAKRYLRSSVSEDQYFDDVSMHSISGHWARVFNTMGPPKKVRFVPAAVLILPKRKPPLTLAMEPHLTGKFVKYNNNCGYVRRKARWTPQAFSHFTYHASHHGLMVVDIQGVDDYYTDPQILSSDGKGYGRGNLGQKGIRRFLESHKCNEVCRAVGLPPLQRDAKGRVITPPASLGGARNSAGPVAPSGAEWLNAVGSSVTGLREEKLPPKAFTISRNTSSGSVTGNEHNSSQIAPRQPRDPVIVSPGRQSLPPGNGAPALVAQSPGNFLQPVGPPPNYGVKYVRYPRHALIRPQSQYFTSAIAGGLMSVPQQSSGTPNGYGGGGSSLTPQNFLLAGDPIGSKVGGSPVHGSTNVPSVMTGVGFHGTSSPSPQGVVMPAVPLLRPPAGGRPSYTGAPPGVVPEGFQPSTAQRASEHAASSCQASHLRHSGTPNLGTGTPNFHPHPPKTGAAGTSSGRCVSHQSTPIGIASSLQSTEEVPMSMRPGSRCHSFCRQPVFSAVEEVKKSSSKSRHHP